MSTVKFGSDKYGNNFKIENGTLYIESDSDIGGSVWKSVGGCSGSNIGRAIGQYHLKSACEECCDE